MTNIIIKRERWVDYFKAMLVLAMILGHSIQFFGEESKMLQGLVVRSVNLISFSGFIFAYGYVINKAYFEKGFRNSFRRMMTSGLKILGAYYISSISFIALMENQIFRVDTVLDVVLLKRFAGWSEFLIAFVLFILLSIIFFRFFEKVNQYVLLVLMVVSLLSCFLSYSWITTPRSALIMGSYDYITFPVIQYSFWFFLGIFFSRNKKQAEKYLFLLSIIATGSYIIYSFVTKQEPSRFPPSPIYILGGAAILYIFRWLSYQIEYCHLKHEFLRKIIKYLESVGKSSLYYLLISNIMIFGFAQSSFSYRDGRYAIIFYIALMIVSRFIQILSKTT